ncbi:MAG: sugar ABC transporter permease [Spirochaetales bacterium]|jgi:putative aldouronate transport system permease protein|nr:sugar ABC transporter permease [Spirochaetales bacterium]
MSTEVAQQDLVQTGVSQTVTKGKGKIFTSKTIVLYMMILPALLLSFLFVYIPLPGKLIAFTDWRMSGYKGWVGFANFKYLFSLFYFWKAFLNQWRLILFGYLFGFPAPIILALLLNELRAKRFRKTIQTITVIPNFINWVVIGGIFMQLLSPRYGYVNDVIRLLGGEGIYFLSKPKLYPFLFTYFGMWKRVGYSAIIYLAALSGVDTQLYEAAVIDGAGRWKQTRYITLPALAPTIVIIFVLSMANVFAGYFEPSLVLKNPMITSTAEILDTYIYEVGLVRAKYPLGAAAGLFKTSVGIVLLFVANWLSKKVTPDKRSIL